MPQVFIFYSRKDKSFAGKITEALKQSNLEIWIDWEDIPPTIEHQIFLFCYLRVPAYQSKGSGAAGSSP